jgi:hypothetical protein
MTDDRDRGWTSNDSRVFPGGLSAAPFLDAGGLSAFTLQEILLQSHGGVLRIAPATAEDWSGFFRLRGEGGFLVAAEIHGGAVRLAEVESLWGRECVLASSWPGRWRVRERDETLVQGDASTIRFPTRPGGSYRIEPPAPPAER